MLCNVLSPDCCLVVRTRTMPKLELYCEKKLNYEIMSFNKGHRIKIKFLNGSNERKWLRLFQFINIE